MATNFYIVEFSGAHPREVEVVHQCWLKDNQESTFWPGFCSSREELKKLLIRGSLPDSSWDIYDINRILSTADATNSCPGMSNEEHSLVIDVGNYELSKEKSYAEQSAQKRIPKQSISKVRNYPHHETFDNSLILDTAECVSFPDKSKDLETKFDALQEYIVKREEKILTLLEENNSMIRSLISSHSKQIEGNVPLNLKMPFNDVSQIEENEEYLKDEANLASTVNYLSLYNGSSASESTRRIMRKVLGKELSAVYNWVGRGEKKAFKNLILKNAIISAVLKDNVATIKDIENCMKSWLKNQNQRVISDNLCGTF